MVHKENNRSNKFRAVFVVVAWILIVSLTKDLRKVNSGFKRIDESVNRLKIEEQKNVELKGKLREINSDYYREKIVRDKLNLQKDGEVIVVLNDDLISFVDNEEKEVKKVDNLENWEKWLAIVK